MENDEVLEQQVQPSTDTSVVEQPSQEGQNSEAEFRITSDGEIQISDSFFDTDNNQQTEETSAIETPETQTEPAVESYTPEEVSTLGIDNLDPARIPEDMKPFYRSMQADYTRKTQALAEEKRSLEQKLAQQPPANIVPPTPTPDKPVENPDAGYYEQLYATAAAAVQKKLGTGFDELNPMHIAALSSEVADIQNKMSQYQQHKQQLDSVVGRYTTDARWNDIQAYADKVLDNLPYSESKVIRDRIQSGDIGYIDKFLNTAKQVFYETDGGTKIATPPPTVPKKPIVPPIKPPVLEGSGTGVSASPSSSTDLNKLGSMSNDELANLFVSKGFVTL